MTIENLVIEAGKWARALGHTYAGTEHILLAYYENYNPQLCNLLLDVVKQRIGQGSYYSGNLGATPSLESKYNNSCNTLDLILQILLDTHCSGYIYLKYVFM